MKKLIIILISLIPVAVFAQTKDTNNPEKQKLEQSLKNVKFESNAYYETLRNIQIYNLMHSSDQIALPKDNQPLQRWRY